MHGGTAKFIQAVPVREEFEGAPVLRWHRPRCRDRQRAGDTKRGERGLE